MPVSEEQDQRRREVLSLLSSQSGPDVSAIIQLLTSAQDDQQVQLGLVGVKMVYENRKTNVQGILDQLQDVTVPQ